MGKYIKGNLKEYAPHLENLGNQPGLTRLLAELIESSSRGATIVVAANDSLETSKQSADYVCDGVDDQVVIQAAIDALPESGGGVRLLEGTFNTTSAIDIASATKLIHLSGMGQSSIINNQNTSDGHGISATNTSESLGIRYGVLISDLTIKGASGGGDGIHLEYADCPAVRNVYAIENGRHGIYITRNAASGFEGDSLIIGSYLLSNTLDGVYVDANVHEAFVLNNHIEDNGRYGVNSHQGNFNVNIIGNNIEDNGSSAIYIGDATMLLIASNVLEGTGDAVIAINGSTWGRIAISCNQIDAAVRGIRFTNSSTIENVSITGNTFDQLTGSSATIQKVNFLSISGNTASRTGELTVGGFYLNTVKQATILGNSLQSEAVSVALGGMCNNCVIADNVFETEYAGEDPNNRCNIRLDTSSNILVSNNILKKYGEINLIENIFISGTLTGSKVAGNHLSGATTPIATITADLIVKDNIGYITKNSGTSTGTGAQQTIAHGLAATPTKVILWDIEDGANPYQSAVADATNIYITAVINQDWGWEVEII